MTTLEQIRKAYDDLSDEDRKTFHQDIADRVHESIAAQERDEGDTDSQSAEDREHEALGEEHADGKGDVEELHETDPEEKGEEEEKEDEPKQKGSDFEERLGRLEEKMSELLDAMKGKNGRESHPATDDEKDKLDRIRRLYN